MNKERELSSQKLSRQRIILWASAGLVALAMITIWLLAGRSRMKQRMKEMSVRQQIAADLHDEVGSSLSSIHMLSQMAEGNGSNRAEIMKRVTEYTRETMDKMGDILWMIKPTETEWTGLKERMQKFLSEICEARQMSCSFQWLEGVKATLNMKQRKGLYLVFKEAVNNAAKYSKAGNVKVSVDYKSNRVILQVNDNGVGFDPLLNSAGNGLGNMKRRASELGGETVIESMPGKGTRIVFSFPA